MDPTDEPFKRVPNEENEPDHAMSPPAGTSGLERLLLVLAVLWAALVFLPLTAETALLHWNIIGTGHEFIALLRKLGLWSFLACLAALGFLKKRKKRAGIRPSFSACLPAFSLPPLGPSRRLCPSRAGGKPCGSPPRSFTAASLRSRFLSIYITPWSEGPYLPSLRIETWHRVNRKSAAG